MPKDPRRDYELNIAQAMRELIQNDIDFKTDFRNPLVFSKTGETSFVINKKNLVFLTIPYYPAMSIYLEHVKYDLENQIEYIYPEILTQVACQHSDLDIATANSIMYLKDVKYTLKCAGNLAIDLNTGQYVQVGVINFTEIERSFYDEKASLWTHISTLSAKILTA